MTDTALGVLDVAFTLGLFMLMAWLLTRTMDGRHRAARTHRHRP